MEKIIINLFISVFLLLFFIQVSADDDGRTWDYDTSSEYTTSSGSIIFPGNGKVQLKEIITPISNITTNGAFDVVTDGNYAYVSNNTTVSGNSKIFIVDVSNKYNPTLVTSINNATTNNGITINITGDTYLLLDGNYLYAISYTARTFIIFDVSNPSSPRALSSISSGATVGGTGYFYGASGIDKVGNLVYVSSRFYDGITVIDVTNPSSPIIKGTINTSTSTGGTGHFDGPRDIKVRGNYAFITGRYLGRFLVVDLSNCQESQSTCNLSLVSSNISGLGEVYGIDIDKTGNYAYLILSGYLHVIDISIPTSPKWIKALSGGNYSFASAKELFVDGDRLYVTADGAINILDISVPSNPLLINKILNNTNGALLNGARGIYKKGNNLYVATTSSNVLQILQIGYDSNAPYIIPNSSLSSTTGISALFNAHGMQNEGEAKYQISNDGGTTWYYFNGSAWLTTTGGVNNSNTTNEINNNINLFNDTFGTIGNYTYKLFLVSDGIQMAEVDYTKIITVLPTININNFNNPNDYLYSAKEKFLFNGKGEVELRVLMKSTGNVIDDTNLNYASNVVVDGNYAYVLTNGGTSSKLNIIDVSNPNNPIIKKTITHNQLMNGKNISLYNPNMSGPGSNYDKGAIIKDGNYLYVMGYIDRALNILDVSSPENPVLLSKYITTTDFTSGYLWYASYMQKVGNYLYVTGDYYDGITIYDVSNPTNVTMVSTLTNTPNFDGVSSFKISGNYVYLTSWWNGGNRLSIADTSNGNLSYVTKYGGGMGAVRDIVINGNYAYISDPGSSAIRIVDISNPSSPNLVKTINTTIDSNFALGDIRSMLVNDDGNILYVSAFGSDSINLIDISNPLNPKFINKYVNNNLNFRLSKPSGIHKVGKYTYVASYSSRALQILEESYSTDSPYLYPKTPFHYHNGQQIISSFSAELGELNEGIVSFQISKDNGENWYYYNGNRWIKATANTLLQSNSAQIINDNIIDFNYEITGGTGEFLFKAFFTSNGEQITSLKNVSIGFSESGDSTKPTLVYSSIEDNSIIPTGNIELDFVYYDEEGGSGINTNGISLNLCKWNQATNSWSTNIINEYLLSSGTSINDTHASYSLQGLDYGKYYYEIDISDNSGNTTSKTVEFYIDAPEVIINKSIFNSTVNGDSQDEIIITIKTIGAPYSLELYKNSPFVNSFGNVIIDWDGDFGVGYDSTSYTEILKNINSYPIFASNIENLNTSGELNTYTHKIKIQSIVEDTQAAGQYSMDISIKCFFSY